MFPRVGMRRRKMLRWRGGGRQELSVKGFKRDKGPQTLWQLSPVREGVKCTRLFVVMGCAENN